MSRPYGKLPKSKPRKSAKRKTENPPFKIKLRGRDGAPLSIPELQQGLYEISRKLGRFDKYRAKWVTVYLTAVDENGEEVILDANGDWVLYPYDSAADEHGV